MALRPIGESVDEAPHPDLDCRDGATREVSPSAALQLTPPAIAGRLSAIQADGFEAGRRTSF